MDFKSPVYFGLRRSNHALINHWIIALIGYGDVSQQYKSILQVCFPVYMNMRGLITRMAFDFKSPVCLGLNGLNASLFHNYIRLYYVWVVTRPGF